jgi:AraC-like DNA-binding protein
MSQLTKQLYDESLRKKSPQPSELVLYNRGYEQCPPLHYHTSVRNYFLVHIIISGRGWFRLGGRRHELSAGQGFTIFPGLIGEYQAHKEVPWSYCWLGFQGAMAEYHLQDLGIDPTNPCFSLTSLEQIEKLLREQSTRPHEYDQNPLAGRGMVYRFLGLLSRELYKRESRGNAGYVYDGIDYIRKNFSQPIKVNDIARSVGVDRTYLFSLFKERTGKSPKEYLTDFRLEAACELLSEHGLSVKAAARSVGYEDELYFSRVFKQQKGIPPSRYKEWAKANQPT